jgi:hypothetical protein
MLLENYREAYVKHSAKAGDVARQLAFAGIAVVWIFKKDVNGMPNVPKELLWPLGAYVLSLGFDLLQYMFASLVWGAFSHFQKRARRHKDDDEIGDPPWVLNWPAIVLFWCKLGAVIVGYWWLFAFVRRTLSTS